MKSAWETKSLRSIYSTRPPPLPCSIEAIIGQVVIGERAWWIILLQISGVQKLPDISAMNARTKARGRLEITRKLEKG